MCVGTSVAIAIAAGATAGGSIAAAKLGSNASKAASKAQVEAGDKALAFQREQYAQQRADFAPYSHAGAAAAGRLADMSAVPPPTFQPGGPPVPFGRQLGRPVGVGPTGPRPGPLPPPEGLAQPPLQPAVQPGRMQIGAPAAPPMGGPAAGGALWTLRAPDGTEAQYPAAQAQQYVQRGATRIA